jgi:hypothetical protein
VRVGAVRPPVEAAAAFTPYQGVPGRTIIRIAEDLGRQGAPAGRGRKWLRSQFNCSRVGSG